VRRVGTFELEKEALKFWNYLNFKGVDSSLEEEDSGNKWSIWVSDEDQVTEALDDLKAFLNDPKDIKFTTSIPTPKAKKKTTDKTFKKTSGFKQFDLKKQWARQERMPGLFTLSLIIVVGAVYLASGMGNNQIVIAPLKMNENVLQGQVWRLVTPIFLHFSFFHIFFNMWWLYDLGTQIEYRKGSKFFLTFVILLAITSNLAQFFASGPNFGGMSGVVYGLFGYVWIKCKLDPGDGFRLDPTVAIIMFGFFFLCFTGVFGNIANLAHAGGLALGIAWGYASALKWNRG
jgi:GlpG protein